MTLRPWAAQYRAVPALSNSTKLHREPEIEFNLVLARIRRLADIDNRQIAAIISTRPADIERIESGRPPDYPTGRALLALLARYHGTVAGLTSPR